MRKKSNYEIISLIVFWVLLVLLEPALYLAFGYLSGWIAKITVGRQAVAALNTTFGTNFTTSNLPWIGAALAWVGSFFKGEGVVRKTFKDDKKKGGCNCLK